MNMNNTDTGPAPKLHDESQCCANTDHELWREREGDYYADSIHVTESGGIGINAGGLVVVKTLRAWVELAKKEILSENPNAFLPHQVSENSPVSLPSVEVEEQTKEKEEHFCYPILPNAEDWEGASHSEERACSCGKIWRFDAGRAPGWREASGKPDASSDHVEAVLEEALKALRPFHHLALVFNSEPYRADYSDGLRLKDEGLVRTHCFLTLGDCRQAMVAFKDLERLLSEHRRGEHVSGASSEEHPVSNTGSRVDPIPVPIWAVCPICTLPIPSPQSGTYLRVANGARTAVHRVCRNEA